MMVSYLRDDVTSKQKPFAKEYRIVRKNDSVTRWVHGRGLAQFDSDGNILSLFGTIQDVTERKLAENEMINITERLQLATSAANLGVWDWNVRNNHMIWNDRMFELYGVTPETFQNSIDTWMNGLHPDDKEAAIAEFQAALKGEKKFETTFRICHPAGTVKYIKASGLVLMGEDGLAERMLGINADISDIKNTEEERAKLEVQLQQVQKMESIGRLAGGVAHDFNNMLTVIIGHSDLGLHRLGPIHPVRADFIEIRKTAERSAALTRQLLAFARKQTIAPKVIDLNEAVTGMLKMLQRLIGEDINLVWKPESSLWPVKVDASQIDQILANLCVNARDAIAGIGSIVIKTENCTTDESYQAPFLDMMPGEYVKLTVSDNGVGMDKKNLAYIFEPFYTTKEQGKGTGLGLATVYGAVKQNSGFIDVCSEQDAGTKFTIYIPRHEGKIGQALKETEAETVPKSHETILLVEDEAAILNIVAMLLTKHEYKVLAASTPGEALNLARGHDGGIDLLMTDVVMPEMNGRDLAKNLLSLYPDIKRLFMSGYTSDVIAHHGVLDEGVHF
ncbi:MAG: PAS domain-containing protein, partial [Proteobacteria bacterium]|nr:PAS domain-containing protein [Pseudomonadota bacterium]